MSIEMVMSSLLPLFIEDYQSVFIFPIIVVVDVNANAIVDVVYLDFPM